MKRIHLILIFIVCLSLAVCLSACFGSKDTTDKDKTETYTEYSALVYDINGKYSRTETLSTTSQGDQYIFFGINGYNFLGYYTETDGKGEMIVDSTGKVVSDFATKVTQKNFNIYPYATVISYTLRFVTGTTEVIESQEHLATDVFDLPSISRTGYDFKGWSKRSDDWTGINHVYSLAYYQDTTLYAIYQIKTTRVSYSAKTSSGELQISYGETKKIPVIEEEGYNFVAYYFSEDFTGEAATDNEGNLLTSWAKEDSYLTLHAKYKSAPRYNLHYANEGYVTKISVTYKNCYADNNRGRYDRVEEYSNNATIKYYAPDPKSGYYFDGWCTDYNCWNKFDFTTAETINEDFTLYPDWKQIPYNAHTNNVLSENVTKTNLNLISKKSTDTTDIAYFCDVTGTVTIRFSVPYSKFSYSKAVIDCRDTTGQEVDKGGEWTKTIEVTKGEVIGIHVKCKYSEDEVYVYYSFEEYPTVTSQKTATMPEEFTVEVTHGNHFEVPVYQKTTKTFMGYFTEANGNGTRVTDNQGKSIGVWTWDEDKTVYAYYR